jgi:hypothetical protein
MTTKKIAKAAGKITKDKDIINNLDIEDNSSLIKLLNINSQLKKWLKHNSNHQDHQNHQEFFDQYFVQIANELLNNYIIQVGNTQFRINEIEFYLKHDLHLDYFTHCDSMQQSNCDWYIHRTGGSYRSGTFKGIDITFGSYAKEVFGGILIRTIENLETGEVFEGPCVCVDRFMMVMMELETKTIDEFASILAKNKFDIFTSALSIKQLSLDNKKVYRSPRVGLTLKKSSGGNAKNNGKSNQQDWIFKPYRFMTSLEKKKGKHYIVLALISKGYDANKIASKTKITVNKVNSLIESYNKGKELTNIDAYLNKHLSENEICELYGALE